MRVTVLLPGVLRANVGETSRVDVEVAERATLGVILDLLAQRYRALDRRLRDERRELRRYVYVGDEECRRLDGAATELSDCDEIHIVPSVAADESGSP